MNDNSAHGLTHQAIRMAKSMVMYLLGTDKWLEGKEFKQGLYMNSKYDMFKRESWVKNVVKQS